MYLKSRDFTFLTSVYLVKHFFFFFTSIHVQIWELDPKEGWAPKNWCFHTVALEKILEIPLDSEETKPVNPKGNQPWIFIRKMAAEVEAQILWPPDAKRQLHKTLMQGKIEGRRRRAWQRMRWLDDIIDSVDINLSKPGDTEGQGSLVFYSPWSCKELDTTEQQQIAISA